MIRARCILLLAAAHLPVASTHAQVIDTVTVTVHGHRMQLLRSGGTGPTVVFESGFTSTQRTWRKLLPVLDPRLHVVTYNRPGLGGADTCPGPRDARTIAFELRAALHAAQIPPPYILVGWSAGGLHTRVFAGLYPAEVSGLLLIDPSPDGFYAAAEREHPEAYRRMTAAESAGIADGSPIERAEDAGWEPSLVQARASDATWTGPLIVLSAPRPDLEELEGVWHRESQAWAVRRNGQFALISGAGHVVHWDRPDSVATALTSLVRQTAAP